VGLVSSVASFVVVLDSTGRVTEYGATSRILPQPEESDEALENSDESPTAESRGEHERASTAPVALAKLYAEEENEKGNVGLSAFVLYFRALGGAWFWCSVLLGISAASFIKISQIWYLGYWARQYSILPPSQIKISRYLNL